MATLNIRRRGQTTLRMPNVRQVDYSAIGNNAYTRLQASGQSFAPAIEQLAIAGTKWIESLNATDEKEASKLAQKVALAQDEAKEQILTQMQLDPSNAFKWEEQWSKAVEGINKQFGVDEMDKNSYRFRQYEEKMMVPTHNARMSMIKAYNNIQLKDVKETAKSSLEFATENVLKSDAMVSVSDIETQEVYHVVDNQKAVDEAYAALDNMRQVEGWSQETYNLKKSQLEETMALGVANRLIAQSQSSKDLDTASLILSSLGGEPADNYTRNATRGAFGAINPNAISPEHRVDLQDAIRRRRTLLDRQEAANMAKVEEGRKQSIAAAEVALLDGSYDSQALELFKNRAIEQGWLPEDILKIQKLIGSAYTKEGNEVIAILGNLDPVARETLWEKTPDRIKNDPLFIERWDAVIAAGAEQEREMFQLGVKGAVEQIVYGAGQMRNVPVAERERMLRQMGTEGKLSPREVDTAVKNLKSKSNARIQYYANMYASAVGNITGALVFMEDPTGESVVDIDKTIQGVYKHFKVSPTKANKEEITAALMLADSLYNGWNEFSSWCEQNPNAEEEQIKKVFGTCFSSYYEAVLKKDLDDVKPPYIKALESQFSGIKQANRMGAEEPTKTYKVNNPADVEVSTRDINAPSNASYEARPRLDTFTIPRSVRTF